MNRDKIERLKRSAIAMRERFPNANEAMQALPVETIIELCNDALREQMEKAEVILQKVKDGFPLDRNLCANCNRIKATCGVDTHATDGCEIGFTPIRPDVLERASGKRVSGKEDKP